MASTPWSTAPIRLSLALGAVVALGLGACAGSPFVRRLDVPPSHLKETVVLPSGTRLDPPPRDYRPRLPRPACAAVYLGPSDCARAHYFLAAISSNSGSQGRTWDGHVGWVVVEAYQTCRPVGVPPISQGPQPMPVSHDCLRVTFMQADPAFGFDYMEEDGGGSGSVPEWFAGPPPGSRRTTSTAAVTSGSSPLMS